MTWNLIVVLICISEMTNDDVVINYLLGVLNVIKKY